MVSKKVMELITKFGGEFCASFLLIFLGNLGDVDKSPFFTPTLLSTSLVWGFSVMIGITTFAHITGGFMSPLITMAAFIHNVIDLTTAIVYFIAQMLGAILGYAVLRGIIPNEYISNPGEFGIPKPKLPLGTSFVMEFVIAFIFINFLSAILDPRNKHLHDSASIKFGFMIFVLHSTAGPLSGAAVNPAKSFAPALYNFAWSNQWLYWLAPFSGAFAGAVLYKFFFAKDYSPIPSNDIEVK